MSEAAHLHTVACTMPKVSLDYVAARRRQSLGVQREGDCGHPRTHVPRRGNLWAQLARLPLISVHASWAQCPGELLNLMLGFLPSRVLAQVVTNQAPAAPGETSFFRPFSPPFPRERKH
jgi:hypothetical protein